MPPRPLIGITGRRKKGDQLVGNLEVLADFSIDLYYADYGRGVLEAGGLPIHIPLDVDPAELIPRLDGVLLTGGADINPQRYGQESSTDAFPPEPLRWPAIQLTRRAIKDCDRRDGRRGPWLSLLDRFGIGFDS